MDDVPATTAPAPGVRRLRLPVPFALEHVNVYLIDAGAGFVLVDTGVATPEGRRALDEGLAALRLGYRDIVAIVLTHLHPDHAGLAAEVRARSGAPVLMSAPEAVALAEMLRNGGVPPVCDDLARHGVPAEVVGGIRSAFTAAGQLVLPFAPDGELSAGHRVDTGRSLEAVATPGHSPGHVCLVLPDADIVLSGDHVLPAITPHVGLYSPAVADPLGDYLGSLRRILERAPGRMLPAHGDPVDDPAARVRELLAHHDRRLDQTLAAVPPEGATAWTIARAVFGEQDTFGTLLALFETLAHLAHLVAGGHLVEIPEAGRLVYSSPSALRASAKAL